MLRCSPWNPRCTCDGCATYRPTLCWSIGNRLFRNRSHDSSNPTLAKVWRCIGPGKSPVCLDPKPHCHQTPPAIPTGHSLIHIQSLESPLYYSKWVMSKLISTKWEPAENLWRVSLARKGEKISTSLMSSVRPSQIHYQLARSPTWFAILAFSTGSRHSTLFSA